MAGFLTLAAGLLLTIRRSLHQPKNAFAYARLRLAAIGACFQCEATASYTSSSLISLMYVPLNRRKRPLLPSSARRVAAPRRRLERCVASYSSSTSLRQRCALLAWRAVSAAFFRAWFGSAPSRISCRHFWAAVHASMMSIAGQEPSLILVLFPLCSRQFSTQFAERLPARIRSPGSRPSLSSTCFSKLRALASKASIARFEIGFCRGTATRLRLN